MPSQYPYRLTVSNEYLGVNKVVRATTPQELTWLVEAQAAKWADQEHRKRQQRQKEDARVAARQHVEDLKWQAEEDTKAVRAKQESLRAILADGIGINLTLDWDQLLDRQVVPPFQFDIPKPDLDRLRIQILGPEPCKTLVASPFPGQRSLLELVLPFLYTRRLEQEAEAATREQKRSKKDYLKRRDHYKSRESEVVRAYNSAVHEYNARRKQEKERYARERDEFLARQHVHNTAVLDFRSRYESGSSEAVEQYTLMSLEKSSYPSRFPLNRTHSSTTRARPSLSAFGYPLRTMFRTSSSSSMSPPERRSNR